MLGRVLGKRLSLTAEPIELYAVSVAASAESKLDITEVNTSNWFFVIFFN